MRRMTGLRMMILRMIVTTIIVNAKVLNSQDLMIKIKSVNILRLNGTDIVDMKKKKIDIITIDQMN